MRKLIGFLQKNILDSPLLDKLEEAQTKGCRPGGPPVFIIGPPRSGTTLLYQLMIISFEMAYLSNVTASIPSIPAVLTQITNSLFKRPERLSSAYYGFINELWAPSEAGSIMRKWFERGAGCPVESIGAIQNIMNAPFLNKNTFNSDRMQTILDYFPNAVFIHMSRDLTSNVASLYSILKDNPNISFGYYPESHTRSENLAINETRRVVDIHQQINEIQQSREAMVVKLVYEQICESPGEAICQLQQLLKDAGVDVQVNENSLAEMPPLTARMTHGSLSTRDLDQIRAAVGTIQPDMNF